MNKATLIIAVVALLLAIVDLVGLLAMPAFVGESMAKVIDVVEERFVKK